MSVLVDTADGEHCRVARVLEPRHATPRHAMPCHATPRHATPWQAMPGHARPMASLYLKFSEALASIKIASISPSQLPLSLRPVCCYCVANWIGFALLSARSSFVRRPCQRTAPSFLPSGSSSASAYSGSRTRSQPSAALLFSVANIDRPGRSKGAQRVETTISGAPGTRLVRHPSGAIGAVVKVSLLF